MNPKEKTSIEVEIYGSPYRLKGSNNAHYIKMIADFVNEQMYRIADKNSRLDRHSIAVLAAVNVADEYFKLKNDISVNKALEESAWAKKFQESQSELEELKRTMESQVSDLKEKLLSESNQQRDELLQELKRLKEEAHSRESLEDQLHKLQDDYNKLQNEYDEWIQLADTDLNK